MSSEQTQTVDWRRRALVLAGGAAALGALGACASRPVGVMEATEVPPPTWREGQSWTWSRTDAYTKLPAGNLTRRVVGRSGEETRVQEFFDNGALYSDSRFVAPGVLLAGTLSDFGPVVGRRFDPPLPLYAYPLQSGRRWGHRGYRYDQQNIRQWMTLDARVEGWETVEVLGRPYRVLLLTRSFNLGPPDPFRGPVYRLEREWYSPDLGGPVRMYSEEYILTRGRVFHQEPGYRYHLVLTHVSPGT